MMDANSRVENAWKSIQIPTRPSFNLWYGQQDNIYTDTSFIFIWVVNGFNPIVSQIETSPN